MEVYNDKYDKHALQSIWRNKLVSTFGKFSRSVALTPVSLDIDLVDSNNGAPAWSSSEHIKLTHDKSKDIASASSIRRLKGLTIHELAHVLYTPRSRSAVGKFVSDNPLFFNSFNILEDSRIENLIVARMSGVTPWLTSVIVNEILEYDNSPDAQASSYTLVYGRKYLDPKLVVAARTKFAENYPSSVMDSLHEIVDAYIRLTFHDKPDSTRAIELIKRFHYEVIDKTLMPPTNTHEHTSSAPDSAGGNKVLGKRETDKDMHAVEQMAKQQEKQLTAQSSNGEDSDESDTNEDSSPSSLSDVAKEVADKAEAQILQDTRDTREQIIGVSKRESFSKPRNDSKSRYMEVANAPHPFWVNYHAPSPEARTSSLLFAKHLAEVKALADPYWDRKVDSGKLNVRNLMVERNIDEAFDRWDDGMSESTDIEAVILLDVSGSMGDKLKPAYEAMWATKRALDSIEASATVIQYGTFGVQLYKSNERANAKVKTTVQGNGATNPLGSLRKAYEILTASSRAIKMLIMITDGDWSDAQSCEEVIINLRSKGVLTGLAFLLDRDSEGNIPWYIRRNSETGEIMVDAHRCEISVDVNDPLKLIDFAKSLADLSRAKLQTV